MKNKCCQEMMGWKVIKSYDINIPKSNVLELEHIKTGAKYIHIANQNEENVFVVAFKTVPTDNSGVAHILEHTALTGSRDYPIRDPFFAMLRRSLQSFMNAFTSEDWTAYPFASPNQKDFKNLMKIYLDAAFFPKLEELNFLQEGWRYAYQGDRLKYEGVVYNEMKGSMSSEDRCLAQALSENIYAEAPYHYNTGGDPDDIPDLSHEQLLDFHKKHYHPSNAYFFTMGNLVLKEHLQLINEKVMDHFERLAELPRIKSETRWSKEREVRTEYPVAKNSEGASQVLLSWLTAKVDDNMEVFSLEMLEDILLGSEASPLRKALLDSGLGEDLSDDSGYDSEPLDTRFSIGLKGVKEKDKNKVRTLILKSLEELIKKGIDKDLITSVINNNELRKRNVQNQPYPYGLQIFLNIMAPWMHGASVEEVLEFDKLLADLRSRIEKGHYFENLIKKCLLDNPHRIFLTMAPNEKLASEKLRQEEARLEEAEKKLSEQEKKQIIDNTKKLNDLQSQDMDLSCLPNLSLEDIDSSVRQEEYRMEKNLYKFRKNSNGLLYAICSYDIAGVDKKSLDLLPFYSYLLSRMDTDQHNYEELNKKIDRVSGGFYTSLSALKLQENSGTLPLLLAQSYCLIENSSKLHNIFGEIMDQSRFEDVDRVKRLLASLYSKYKASIVANGHIYASRMALAALSDQAYMSERWQGISQMRFLENLKKENNDLASRLTRLHEDLLHNSSIKVALISDQPDWGDVFASFKRAKQRDFSIKNTSQEKLQTFSTSTSVSFVAAALSLPAIGHKDSPALLVLAKILARGYLHNEIREKGGAYGGFARYNHLDGSWWFGSYRDPEIRRTLETIARAKEHIANKKIGSAELEETIISVSADIDSPKTEVEKAKGAYFRTLAGLSDERRQEFREALLALKVEDVQEVADKYLQSDWRDYSVAVISSQEKIDEASLST